MMLLPQLASPCEVNTLQRFLDDDLWVMEQKLDGHRLLLRSPGGDMAPTALTRNGTVYSRRLPKAIQDFRFPPGEWALDGELVDGVFYVFDMPWIGHMTPDLSAHVPLQDRRVMLETLLGSSSAPGLIRHPFKLVPQARTRDEKIALAERALADHFEGLIVKRVDSPYRPGARTPEWLKIKFVATADCVVGKVRDDGKESANLLLMDHTIRNGGKVGLVPVGRCSLIGKPDVKPGDVVEVRYLYAGAGGRLYQPTLLRKRDDKLPSECTIDQMKHVNKSVLEAL